MVLESKLALQSAYKSLENILFSDACHFLCIYCYLSSITKTLTFYKCQTALSISGCHFVSKIKIKMNP